MMHSYTRHSYTRLSKELYMMVKEKKVFETNRKKNSQINCKKGKVALTNCNSFINLASIMTKQNVVSSSDSSTETD